MTCPTCDDTGVLLSDPQSLALRALRDCTVIRASNSHPGYQALFVAGLAKVRVIPNRHIVLDYTLTPSGLDAAAALPLVGIPEPDA